MTPREAMHAMRDTLGPRVAGLLRKAGVSQANAAECVGVAATHLSEMLHGTRRLEPAILWLLPPAARIAIAEDIAGPGYMVVAVPEAGDVHGMVDVLDSLQVAIRDVGREVLRAFSTGHMDRTGGARGLDAANLAHRELGALGALFTEAHRTGVVDVVRRAAA